MSEQLPLPCLFPLLLSPGHLSMVSVVAKVSQCAGALAIIVTEERERERRLRSRPQFGNCTEAAVAVGKD